ncbi:hypothetical protein UNDYM_3282 [Undibacterium sp. YM2]|uniref:hypothetical protein n=1 Tax=Undibacterium sp. YM2 TaxID=2058625 RepID=UPI001331F47C|nr:hypothetical protein [Undibacterium sp. YM2]BBB67535.1 hypothetical protein UNDYM_3282 [Undibacterium sp. YM2]
MNNKKLKLIAFAIIAASGSAANVFAADWPSGFSKCADEGGTCKVGDKALQVSFGLKDKWVIKSLSGNVSCTAATFGVAATADTKENVPLAQLARQILAAAVAQMMAQVQALAQEPRQPDTVAALPGWSLVVVQLPL